MLYITTLAAAESNVQCIMQQEIKYCTKDGKAFSGRYEQRDSTGQLASVENYHNGYLSGLATYWDNEGKLKERLYFKNGVKNGMDKVYYENRTIKYLLKYKDGLLDGRMDIYTEDGKLKGRLNYHEGELRSGFCVDEQGTNVNMTYQEIAQFPNNKLETCGVQ